MSKTITGRVVKILERRQGTSASGQWASDSFVITEVGEQYPDSCIINVFSNDSKPRWNDFAIVEGEVITVHYSMSTRTYTDKAGEQRFIMSLDAYKVERNSSSQPVVQQPAAPSPAPAPGAEDKMPF